MPDLVGELIGWRAWTVERVGPVIRLCSVIRRELNVWPVDRFMVATCEARRSSDDHGDIPGTECSCGIYAARDRDSLLELEYGSFLSTADADMRVMGEVALSGLVVPGEWGWRSARARVHSLQIPYSAWRLAEKLTAYRVPIALGNPFKH